MRTFIYVLIIAGSVCNVGCSEETPSQKAEMSLEKAARDVATNAVTVIGVEEYRRLLEKRKKSVGGAEINIMQEVRKFERASEDERRELFKKAKELAR